MSRLVVDTLAAHIEAFGPGADGLVFHIDGRPVSQAHGGKYVIRAATGAGLAGRTWPISVGAAVPRGEPALVAERLGHDVATLLETYAHVIRPDDDRVRSIVDDTLGARAEDWLRTEAG